MLNHPTDRDPPLQIVFDLDSLLIDTLAGVRHALNAVAHTRGSAWLHPLTHEDLRCRSLADFITEIAGTDDPALIAELIERYWRVYEQDSRYRAPLRPGAEALLDAFEQRGAELHYVSTYGPQIATLLVRRHALQQRLTSVYTAPLGICPCARAGLFETFIAGRKHPADAHLLLSDQLSEIYTAQRLHVPVLALGYGCTPPQILDSVTALLGVAHTPDDVANWLLARDAAALCLRRACAPSARLH